jgi:hypothetical protein
MENGRPGSAIRGDDPRSPRQRWLEVAPERLDRWLAEFADRHGEVQTAAGTEAILMQAADGAVAECHVPFPPLSPGAAASPALIAEHALADRTVGVLLVRLGGYAAGVFTGEDAMLAASKVGSRLVHGRSAAGGTSQHRFARRREKQAREALEAAADCAAGVFGQYRPRGAAVPEGAGPIDAVVLGGDKRAMSGLREDPRLRPYFAIAVDRFLTVPDPKLAVLRGTPRMFRAIRIRLTEPADGGTARGGRPAGNPTA